MYVQYFVKENVVEFYGKPYFLYNITITQACKCVKKPMYSVEVQTLFYTTFVIEQTRSKFLHLKNPGFFPYLQCEVNVQKYQNICTSDSGKAFYTSPLSLCFKHVSLNLVSTISPI